MLAAKSLDSDYNPAPFTVALQILSSDRALPERLAVYVQSVLEQALQISENPNSLSAETLPEAIQLAIDLQVSKSLRRSVGASIRGKAISAAVAKEILEVERRLAATG